MATVILKAISFVSVTTGVGRNGAVTGPKLESLSRYAIYICTLHLYFSKSQILVETDKLALLSEWVTVLNEKKLPFDLSFKAHEITSSEEINMAK